MAEKTVKIEFTFRTERAASLAGMLLCMALGMLLTLTNIDNAPTSGLVWIGGLLCGIALGFWVRFLTMSAPTSTRSNAK